MVKAKKIEQLKEFCKSYVELMEMLENLEFYAGQNRKIEESEIRKNIIELYKFFKWNLMYLKLLITTEERIHVNELENTLDNILLKLDFSRIKRNIHGYITDKNLLDELRRIRDVVRKTEIPKLLDKIRESMNKDFGIK